MRRVIKRSGTETEIFQLPENLHGDLPRLRQRGASYLDRKPLQGPPFHTAPSVYPRPNIFSVSSLPSLTHCTWTHISSHHRHLDKDWKAPLIISEKARSTQLTFKEPIINSFRYKLGNAPAMVGKIIIRHSSGNLKNLHAQSALIRSRAKAAFSRIPFLILLMYHRSQAALIRCVQCQRSAHQLLRLAGRDIRRIKGSVRKGGRAAGQARDCLQLWFFSADSPERRILSF